jgi:hypothetical protein
MFSSSRASASRGSIFGACSSMKKDAAALSISTMDSVGNRSPICCLAAFDNPANGPTGVK